MQCCQAKASLVLQEEESKDFPMCTCIRLNYVFLEFLQFNCLGHAAYFGGPDALLGNFS